MEHISADAIADGEPGQRSIRGMLRPANRAPKTNIVFPVRVRLGESRLRLPARAQATALQPGMLARRTRNHIATGSRTVMAYLLSPIAKATSEAGRER